MAAWKWRTLPDGRVEVDQGDGFKLIMPRDVAGVHTTLERVMTWRSLAQEMGDKWGVPPAWILAVIFAESGGKAEAENYCCIGLMAIMGKPPIHGKTPEELRDPRINVDTGAKLLSSSRKRGLDLPQAASVHVAGAESDGTPHPSSKSLWGMREHTFDQPLWDGARGYIQRVVQAHNAIVELLSQAQPPVPATPPSPPPPTVPVTPLAIATPGPVMATLAATFAVGYAIYNRVFKRR